MTPLGVEEHHVPPDLDACLRYADIGFGIGLFVFQTAPQALDEHITDPSPLAVHADTDVVFRQHGSTAIPRLSGQIKGLSLPA